MRLDWLLSRMQTSIRSTAFPSPPPLPATLAANEKLASGPQSSLTDLNVWQTQTFTPQMQWGNDYMHARYYSSNLGRFLSVDPVGGKVGSSQSWNRYSYVRNNPVAFIDPNGEELRLGADPARGIAAVKLMLPVGVRNAVTVGRNDSGQPTVLIDPSAESDSLNFRNLKAVVQNPGIVELNVGNEFSYHNENGDTGTLSLSFTGLRGVTLPSREAAGPEGGMFSTQEGVTEIYVQESESEVVQAVMVAQEIAGHALPGLLGQGAAISDRDAHQKREYPARADALINILYWWDFGEHE